MPTAKAKSEVVLNRLIRDEIARILETNELDSTSLERFAYFVIDNYKKKDPKPTVTKATKAIKAKPLTLAQLKEAIYKKFGVASTDALKKSGSFQIATSGMDKVDLSKKVGWESLYRKLIGVLPEEENEQGYGCINGINIFKYDLPWRAFGLDPKVATTENVRSSYYELSKIYHPDKSSGDAQIFDRLTVFYKSLTEKF